MSVKTYSIGPSPDSGTYADCRIVRYYASDASNRPLQPGEWVTHRERKGKGIVVAVTVDELVVFWSVEPESSPFDKFVMPNIRRAHQPRIAPDLVSVQPMSLPPGNVFYLDYTYGTGSLGEPAEPPKKARKGRRRG